MTKLKRQLAKEESTNRAKLERLLEPPHRSGRVRIVDRPINNPRRCALTGKFQDDFFVDLGFDTGDFMGAVYLSSTIFKEICKLAGYVEKDEYISQLEQNVEITGLFRKTLEHNERLRGLINEFISIHGDSISDPLLERFNLLVSELEQQAESRIPPRRVRQKGSSDSGSDEQSSVQGLADVFNSKSAKSVPTII